MIAFATSLLFGIVGSVAVVAYGKRRKPGQSLSWGEAMVAAVFAFILMMLWYGVIPHQWITLADAEWAWRSDRIFFGPLDVFKPGRFLPLTVTYVVLRDFVTLGIYGAGLTLHVGLWMHWQNRSKTKAVVVPTTAYGRPLARKG